MPDIKTYNKDEVTFDSNEVMYSVPQKSLERLVIVVKEGLRPKVTFSNASDMKSEAMALKDDALAEVRRALAVILHPKTDGL